MLVHLATAYPTQWSYLSRFRERATQDRYKVHTLTEDPGAADIILFVDARHEHGDWLFRAMRKHELVRRFPEKCFVYNETDQPWCCMPGLYVSMPSQWYHRGRMRASSYLGVMNPYIETEAAAFAGEPDLLFSFAGRRCVPVRDRILELSHARAVIEDTSSYNFFGAAAQTPEEIDGQRRAYAGLLLRSKFILCPRGSGPASFRLFEALAAGRVPVILGDEWVPIEGPDWEACSVRLPEAEAGRIPAVLEELEPRFPAMAARARETWADHFSESAIFHRMIEACLSMKRERRLPEGIRRRLPDARHLWLTARIARNAVRTSCREFLQKWSRNPSRLGAAITR